MGISHLLSHLIDRTVCRQQTEDFRPERPPTGANDLRDAIEWRADEGANGQPTSEIPFRE